MDSWGNIALAALYLLSVGCDQVGCEPAEEVEERSVRGAAAAEEELVTEEGFRVITARREEPDRSEEIAARERNLTREPTSPDPHPAPFTLDEAVAGLGTDGTLVAEFTTDFGTIFCDLYAEEVPKTVAHFIGLARGLRPWWDAVHAQWRTFPAYDRTSFFRVIPEAFIQGGDYLDDGTGTIGFWLEDEGNPRRTHDRAGQLCMASAGENQNGAQFFITDGPQPELDADSGFTIFGQCQQTELVERIARVAQGEDNRPLTAVHLTRVQIHRVQGGAESARVRPPEVPEGLDLDTLGLEASPGPGGSRFPGIQPPTEEPTP